KLAVGRELTKSNLLRHYPSKKGITQDCTVSSLTSAEQAWIGNRGRRFLISEIFTLDHADKSDMAECSTGPFYAPNRRTRPEQFQLARALWKKGGRQYFSRVTRVRNLDSFRMIRLDSLG